MYSLRKLIRSSAFRLAGFYLIIFGISAAGLLSLVYWRSTVFTAQQIDETISAEIQGLQERYRLLGIPGLTQIIAERSRRQSQSLYLLVGPQGQRLAGNVDGWPTSDRDAEGWTDFDYLLTVGDDRERREARGRILGIIGGFSLLVGRDVQQREDLVRLIESAFWWATAGILALGLAGGLLISRHTLGRIEAMAEASAQIMAGDLTRRVPIDGSGDELDRLAESLNAMLERIEGLMTAVRQVSDNIAHDLRTPLNRLRARAEVALMAGSDPEGYREALERTLQDADALLATFNALLDIARLEGAADAGPNDRIDLAEIVEDIADLYDPVAEDAGITLIHDAPADVAVVLGDRRLLAQALANLVDNAIKYTPSGGQVRVRAA
ncbi:MAG: HAMP domain-containing protein, partial [Alphaproteobacteria bacterium]